MKRPHTPEHTVCYGIKQHFGDETEQAAHVSGSGWRGERALLGLIGGVLGISDGAGGHILKDDLSDIDQQLQQVRHD